MQEMKKSLLLAPSFLYDEARRELKEEYLQLERLKTNSN